MPSSLCSVGRDFFFLKKMIGISEEDPLEKEMATCSSILIWEIPWTEEPGGVQSMGWHSDTTEAAKHTRTV